MGHDHFAADFWRRADFGIGGDGGAGGHDLPGGLAGGLNLDSAGGEGEGGNGGSSLDGLSGGDCSAVADWRFLPGMNNQDRQGESGGGGKNRGEKGKSRWAEGLNMLAMNPGNGGLRDIAGGSATRGEGTGE